MIQVASEFQYSWHHGLKDCYLLLKRGPGGIYGAQVPLTKMSRKGKAIV